MGVRHGLMVALVAAVLPIGVHADDLLGAFLARHDEPIRSYRARRHLEAENARFNLRGWLDVETSLGPDGWSYDIVAEGGSPTIRKRVLRAALEGERDLIQ